MCVCVCVCTCIYLTGGLTAFCLSFTYANTVVYYFKDFSYVVGKPKQVLWHQSKMKNAAYSVETIYECQFFIYQV